MAQVQPPVGVSNAGANTILAKVPTVVETGATFGSWTRRPYLECLHYNDVVAPNIGQATLRFRYGRIKREDRIAFAREQAQLIVGHYFRVLRLDTTPATEIFHGTLEVEHLKPFSSALGAGDQYFTGVGICHELDREALRFSKAVAPNGALVTIDWFPAANQRYEQGEGPLGNRSNNTVGDGFHVFSSDGAIWTVKDLAGMILKRYPPAGGPNFVLGGMTDVLNNIMKIWCCCGMTPWQALNMMINRSRGLCFAPVVSGNTVTLIVQSTLDEPMNLGEYTVPANSHSVYMTVDDGILNENVNIVRSLATRFDQIEVRGARILTCFTINARTMAERGWTAATEAAYITASSASTGFGSLSSSQQKMLNDDYRNADAFGEVFTKQRLLKTWYDSSVMPKCDDNGDVSFGGPFFSLGKFFESWLPLEEGKDYTVYPPTSTGQPANVEATYLAPFAAIQYTDGAGKTRLGMVDSLEGDNQGARAHFSVYPRELAWKVEGAPNHMFAKNDWSGASLSSGTPLLDYRDIQLTVALRSDAVLKVVAKRFSAGTRIRKKIIEMPDAECWMVAPGTMVGFGSELQAKFYGGPPVVRNDVNRLRSVAAHALAWYSKDRAAVSITYRRIDNIVPLGSMLKSVVTGGRRVDSNAIVTSRAVDLTSRRVTIQTGFFEMDFEDAVRD